MFKAVCLFLLRDLAVASVVRFVGERDTRLWRMLDRQFDETRESKDLAGVGSVVGEDLAIRKGHSYATVFADARKRDVLFATETKEDSNWGRFADDLRAHGGDPGRIKHASMDMNRSYPTGVKRDCPNGTRLFDKFHVSKLANEAIHHARRRASRELPWCGERRKKAAPSG